VPPFVLTVLKVVFLALLYFFIYRAIRSVVADIRPVGRAAAGRAQGSRDKPIAKPRGGGKAPRSLVVLDEHGSKVETIQLNGTLQVGRAEACQIRLPDTYASSFHARIYSRDGSWYIEDLGSTNGTYLNQRRITAPAELRAGDKVKIGKTTLDLRR
jgi:pSer/pThr/pTyr-binding forkhead associated (FHA) protein